MGGQPVSCIRVFTKSNRFNCLNRFEGYFAAGGSNTVGTVAEFRQHGGSVARQRRKACKENGTGHIDDVHWRGAITGSTITGTAIATNPTIFEYATVDEPATKPIVDAAAAESAESNATTEPTK